LVFTAFSGSHQDAINKGLAARKTANDESWEVPYLPIDPVDIGRTYEAVIRINSQSGKGGVAHVLERGYGLQLPRFVQTEFAAEVQRRADATGRELTADEIMALFSDAYLRPGRIAVADYAASSDRRGGRVLSATVTVDGAERTIDGTGGGPVEAFVEALAGIGIAVAVRAYHEHALTSGSEAEALCYVQMVAADGRVRCGAGHAPDVTLAALMAVCSAVNRM
jgi:2-isopropylmalate synthase